MSDVSRHDGNQPLFVFDGKCVLCSGGVRWLMRSDRGGKVAFASAQSPLGQSLYDRFGMALDESYLLVVAGHALTKTDGYLRLFRILGGIWTPLMLFALIPRAWRDRAYDWVVRNRYRIFGRTEHCALLTSEQRARLID